MSRQAVWLTSPLQTDRLCENNGRQIDMEGQLPMRGRGAGGSVWTKCDWGWSVISASLGLSPGLDTKEVVGVG